MAFHCDSVISADTDITFTYTVLYTVAADEEADYTGRPGLTDVAVIDNSGQICQLPVVLVNIATGCTS